MLTTICLLSKFDNMADAAAARREARRRRILENSQNRLQFISGKSGNDSPRESPVRFPAPEQNCEFVLAAENNYLTSVLNGVLANEPESFPLLSSSHDHVAAGDGELANDLAALIPPNPEPTKLSTPLMEKLLTHKYDIVLLSLFIQLLHSLSLFTFEGTYFFLPLFVYSVTKLIWYPKQGNSSIANVVLLLNGVSANRVHKLLNVSQWISVLSQDVCVFLFTTICIQSLFITLIT